MCAPQAREAALGSALRETKSMGVGLESFKLEVRVRQESRVRAWVWATA